MMSSKIVQLFLSTVLVLGCSGSSGTTPDAGNQDGPVADLQAADVQAADVRAADTIDPEQAAWDKVLLDYYKGTYCPMYKQCYASLFRANFKDLDTCAKDFVSFMSTFRGAGFTDKTSELKKCLDASSKQSNTCDGFVVLGKKGGTYRKCKLGRLKIGAICSLGVQCESSYCKVLLPDDECGVCQGLSQIGENCTYHGQCADDLLCHSQKCAKPTIKGGDCTSQPCPLPEICVSGKCSAIKKDGEACTWTYECQRYHVCNPTTHKCESPSFASSGQTCGILKDLWSTFCEYGALCALDGKCAGPLPSGATCTANPPLGISQCRRPGEICASGTCQTISPKLCSSGWTSVSGKPQKKTSAPRNWWPTGGNVAGYELLPDFATLHKGEPTGHIKSKAVGTSSFGALGHYIYAATYLGKRVRMSGWVRSKDITGKGALWMRVDDAKGKNIGFDNMKKRPIQGTADFTKYEIVLDIHASAHRIVSGILLSGDGEMWVGETTFEVVDKSVPTTN